MLTDAFGWRAVFAVNVPLVTLIAALALRVVPADDQRPAPGRLDVPGAVLTTAAAVLVVMGFTFATADGPAAATTLGCLVAGAATAAVLPVVERRTRDPLLDLRRFGNLHLATGTSSTFLFMAGFGATAYFLTLYFQQVRGLGPLVTGLAFVVPCAAVLVGTTLGGRLATRAGLRAAMLTGQVVGLVGCAAFAAAVDASTAWPLVLALTALFSLGQGIVFTTMYATAATGTPAAEQGTASGIATTGQQLGGAIGLAVLVTVAGAGAGAAMAGISVIIVLGIAVACAIPGRRRAQ